MHLSKVYVRFYRSFNYDYLRKSHKDAARRPWDNTADGLFYPFVHIPLEQGITTVVGANESGKSQLLSAMRCGLTGDDIDRGDFCRYSQFFGVEQSMLYPDFGLEVGGLDDADKQQIRLCCEVPEDNDVDKFAVFRLGGANPVVYIPQGDDWQECAVEDQAGLDSLLPTSFTIDASIPLPDSVSIDFLATGDLESAQIGRRQRQGLFRTLLEDDRLRGASDQIQAAIKEAADQLDSGEEIDPESDYAKQLRLADDLLCKVARVDRSAFAELYNAVQEDTEGYANGLVEQINRSLAKHLNFAKWWSQDQRFQLLVTLRDFDLVFTIRDRTGTEYSFAERSGGLKYFLSYFVQYLAHEYPEDGRTEVLLMDEPDAYLSSMGQQDLLRIFEAFAYPQDDRPRVQVVYVTHSPFLIDKNHSERIRVLEKGEGEEGTRVVRNVSRNHYEPLRSAFGSFVGETTFISNCNLMLEGASDQILLVGMSSRLAAKGVPRKQQLDLNSITLVPAGSASEIPYLVYLARGRDVDRPDVIVMLDSDGPGDEAKKALKRGGARNKQLLDPELILQLGDLGDALKSDVAVGIRDIEDLIPVEIAWMAVKRYVSEFLGSTAAKKLDDVDWRSIDFGELDMHDTLECTARAKLGEAFHLDKIGLARSVVGVAMDGSQVSNEALAVIDQNFQTLFDALNERQRKAVRAGGQDKNSTKINRLVHRFFQDHPVTATREAASLLLEEIETAIVSTPHSDLLKSEIRRLRTRHSLEVDLADNVENFDALKGDFEGLATVEERASQP